jgi:lipid-A-disaccharide synthase-like uncharacterized protein
MDWLLRHIISWVEQGGWWPETWAGRIWVLFGFCAQGVFASRFVVQWLASERRGRSYIPVAFWYISLVGGIMLFSYAAVYKKDIVFTLGQTTGCLVYIRNLMLLRHEKTRLPAPHPEEKA